MIHNILSEKSEAAAHRHLLLLNALQGAFSGAMSQVDPTTPIVLARLTGQGYDMAMTHLRAEGGLIEAATSEIALRARSDAQDDIGAGVATQTLPERVTTHLGDSVSYLSTEIAIQIERDVASLRKAWQTTALEINLAAAAKGIGRRAAIVQYKIADQSAPRFHFRDRAGRLLPSQKYIRTAWRQHLLSVHNEVYLFTLAEHGHESAVVHHPNERYRFAGKMIGTTGGGKHPSYAEIRDEVFHPNSEATIKAIK